MNGGIRAGGPQAVAVAIIVLAMMLAFAAAIVYTARRRDRLGTTQAGGNPLRHYVALSFAISWLFWVPVSLSLIPDVLIAGGAFGPIAAGFLLAAQTDGRAGVRNMLRRLVLWRVAPQWYLFTLLAFPVLLLVTTVDGWLKYAALLVSQVFISGLAEEPGWRGFALPRLQKTSGPLKASVILGVLWGCWHLPLFLIPGYEGTTPGLLNVSAAFGIFLVGITSTSVLFTWVFNHTRQSLLIAVLLHASANAALAAGGHARIVTAALTTALAITIITATRGRLH